MATIRYSLPGGFKGTFVTPRPDEHGYGQSPYGRGRYNLIQSSRLKEFHRCIARQMEGKSFKYRGEVRRALAAAAAECSREV